MKQQTLAMAADHDVHFEKYRKPTRRDKFLATMDKLVSWAALCNVIEPHYCKAGNGDRRWSFGSTELRRSLRPCRWTSQSLESWVSFPL